MTIQMQLTPDLTVKAGEGNGKTYIRRRSIFDMTNAMQWAIDERDARKNRPRSSVNGTESFCATRSIEEYVGMLRDGWLDGIDGMQTELAGMTSDAAEQLVFERSPGGAFPIVPAYLSNDPCAMLRPTFNTTDNTRGLTLVIDSCFTGCTATETILEYARTVMRLVCWLQAQRIDVSVYSILPIRMASKRIVYTIPIREAGDVMQPERIASVLHPSWLRRAWFAMVEYEYCHDSGKSFPECKVCTQGYGSVTHANVDEIRAGLPDAYSVILLPKPGRGDPAKAVEEVTNLKIRF